jgi:hypothetical protein
MKKIIPILFLFFSISFHAQSTIKITTKKCISRKGFYLRLKSVFDDSRCPENVQCIRAGEVSVLVALYNDKQLLEEKTIIFNSKNREENIKWFENYLPKKIKGIGVMPYPKEGVEVNPKKQYVSIVFVD